MASSSKAYRDLQRGFVENNPRSEAIYEKAVRSLPGGNTRSVLFYSPFPVAIRKASGSRLFDADGHEYIDMLGEYTAGLYGHSDPYILRAITEAANRGLNYGGHHEDESKLADLVKQRFSSIELLRFTNSGTEATLMALAAARAYTQRNKILVFGGAYHGGAFSFGGGRTGPVNAPFEFLIGEYNNADSAKLLVTDPKNVKDIAAVLVEPMLGSGGAIPATHGFLGSLRHLATQTGAVLIFDEVMTSRMHQGGGIQSRLPSELRPDMTTLGKYIGGGLSFGAFGGKRSIMEQFDPRRTGALAHAGTFNNNTLTMAAGRVGLEKVFTSERAANLHRKGEDLRKTVNDLAGGTLLKATGYGSIMTIHFTETPVEEIRRPSDVGDTHKVLGDVLHLFLLSKGFYIARRGFIALSLALSDDELSDFVTVMKDFIQTYRQVLQPANTRARL